MSSKWIKVGEDTRKRHPLYALDPWLYGFIASLGGSMVVSGMALVVAAHATSHLVAIRIALDIYIYVQITQVAVAALAVRNVLAAHPVRLLLVIGLGVTAVIALLACLFMMATLDETSLWEDLLDRIGSEPFFTLDLLVDPLHPIVDLLSSYYLRSVETETIGRDLSEILALTAAILLFRDLPLCLFVTFSRRLRIRCEGEAHRADDMLNPLKRALQRVALMLPKRVRSRAPGNSSDDSVRPRWPWLVKRLRPPMMVNAPRPLPAPAKGRRPLQPRT